jgi:ketosteroid isomerase-like protein
VEALAPDGSYTNPDYAVEGGVREGRDAVRASLQQLHDNFDYVEVIVKELIEGPEGVLVVVYADASGRESGAPLQGTFFHALRFRGDEVVDFAWFVERAEGLRAVGLAPGGAEQQQ